ncbi:tandem-95 repeat protein, partial [Vibrio splendidus]
HTVDVEGPTVMITAANTSLSAGEVTTITFDFSEAVEDFDASDIETTGGMLINLTQDETDPSIWTATFTQSGNETPSVSVTDESYTDVAGNLGAQGTLSMLASPTANDDTYIHSHGLSGAYYGHNSQVSSVAVALSVINAGDPDVTFTATDLDYSLSVTSGVDDDTQLRDFLGDDADSISGNVPNGTTDGVFNLTGAIYLDEGEFALKVNADDGYSIVIDGVVVAEVDRNQSPTERIHDVFEITDAGYHTIEIVYWDQGGNAVLDIDIGQYDEDGNLISAFTPLLDAPTLNDELSTVEDVALIIDPETLLGNDTDPDGDVLSIISVQDENNGRASIDPITGKIIFEPAENYSGEATFTYTVSDNNGGSSTAKVTVFVSKVNDASALDSDISFVKEEQSAAGNVLTNDYDQDDTLTVDSFRVDGQISMAGNALTLSGIGSIVIESNGDYVFTPISHWSGDVPAIEYTTNTGASASLNIKVEAVADIPTIEPLEESKVVFDSGFETGVNGQGFYSQVGAWKPASGAESIEVWVNGSQMLTGNGRYITVNASEGQNIVELNSSENFANASGIQTNLDTTSGKLYTITLDVAPRPGYGASVNSFDVVVEGIVVGTWSASGIGDNSLNWNEVQFSFMGSDDITNIQLIESGVDNRQGRGVLIDDIKIVEHDGVQAGNSDPQTHIELVEYINGSLVDIDGSESLSYEIGNIPLGGYIYVGGVLLTPTDGKITLTTEQLQVAKLAFDKAMIGSFSLTVSSIALEASNDSSAKSVPAVIDFVIAKEGVNTSPITSDSDLILTGDFNDQITSGWVQSPGLTPVRYDIGDANIIDSQAGNDHVASGSGNDTIMLGESHTPGFDETPSAYQAAIVEKNQFATGSDASKLNEHDLDSFVSGYSPSAHVDAAHAGDGSDSVYGQEGIDLIYGGNDDDYLDGGIGDDVLRGGVGSDTLVGGSGNDILIGGTGNDILTGGEGDDIFKWVDDSLDNQEDVITDFNRDSDNIDLSELVSDTGSSDMNDLLSKIDVSIDGEDLTLTIPFGSENQTIVLDHAATQFNEFTEQPDGHYSQSDMLAILNILQVD